MQTNKGKTATMDKTKIYVVYYVDMRSGKEWMLYAETSKAKAEEGIELLRFSQSNRIAMGEIQENDFEYNFREIPFLVTLDAAERLSILAEH